MMVEGSLLTLVLFGWLFLRAAREGEERQELLDLAQARGVELTERARRGRWRRAAAPSCAGGSSGGVSESGRAGIPRSLTEDQGAMPSL